MKALYYVVYGLWYAFSLLPLRVHYVLSDVLYLLVYRLAGYRVGIVRKNLEHSFPEMTVAELRQTERRFYHWFCDYLVETVKLLTIRRDHLRRRMEFRGVEAVDRCVREGQSCAVYLGHLGNWEWIASLPLWVTAEAQCGQIYHALENATFDQLFLRLRQRWGAVCIPMAEILRRSVEFRRKGQATVIGYIADQVPFWNNIHHWCQFLHQDTPVLTGTERIARKMNQALFYIDVSRPRRGHYVAEFKLITRQPAELGEYEATDRYFSLLEQSIRRQPELWLWTHNRWKRTREEFDRRFIVVDGKVMPKEERQ
ncbi:MAG: lysophospholipid acyltransferase family protein [Prevotella sp.]|nr:lysophospholipid acyltransferase family protein [Prevotella sp.]